VKKSFIDILSSDHAYYAYYIPLKGGEAFYKLFTPFSDIELLKPQESLSPPLKSYLVKRYLSS
jgi:hypothetical protein